MLTKIFVICVALTAVNSTVVKANVLPIDDSNGNAHVVELTEKSIAEDDTTTSSGDKLVRGKRFLNNIIGSAVQSLRSDNWRECGRTSWGTTIYTNGIGTACFGACPQRVRCGYGYDNGFDGNFRYGYQGRYDFGRINLG